MRFLKASKEKHEAQCYFLTNDFSLIYHNFTLYKYFLINNVKMSGKTCI